MIVLKAIGRFFARIGRWIKDTAWVQPLLIVGGIFAIIFAINPISKWVQSWFSGDESEKYYQSYQLSLKGAETGSSDADKLLNYMEGKTTTGYPSKFYVAFVSTNCENCSSCYMGYKLFGENFNKSLAFKIDNDKIGDGYKFYTIYVNQRNDDDELLFDDFLRNHANYFEEVFGALNDQIEAESYHYYNNTSDKSTFKNNVKSFYDCIGADEDEDDVSTPTPTTFLFDKNSTDGEIYGNVTQVFFNYVTDVKDSSDNYQKAYYLVDSWNYKGDFAKKEN